MQLSAAHTYDKNCINHLRHCGDRVLYCWRMYILVWLLGIRNNTNERRNRDRSARHAAELKEQRQLTPQHPRLCETNSRLENPVLMNDMPAHEATRPNRNI